MPAHGVGSSTLKRTEARRPLLALAVRSCGVGALVSMFTLVLREDSTFPALSTERYRIARRPSPPESRECVDGD